MLGPELFVILFVVAGWVESYTLYDECRNMITSTNTQNLLVWKGILGGDCYFETLTPKSWDGGREDCIAVGGELATVHSYLEWELVRMITQDTNHWTGLYREIDEKGVTGDWKWSNGEDFGFYKGIDPNAAVDDNKYNCGVLSNGLISIDDCSVGRYKSVCVVLETPNLRKPRMWSTANKGGYTCVGEGDCPHTHLCGFTNVLGSLNVPNGYELTYFQSVGDVSDEDRKDQNKEIFQGPYDDNDVKGNGNNVVMDSPMAFRAREIDYNQYPALFSGLNFDPSSFGFFATQHCRETALCHKARRVKMTTRSVAEFLFIRSLYVPAGIILTLWSGNFYTGHSLVLRGPISIPDFCKYSLILCQASRSYEVTKDVAGVSMVVTGWWWEDRHVLEEKHEVLGIYEYDNETPEFVQNEVTIKITDKVESNWFHSSTSRESNTASVSVTVSVSAGFGAVQAGVESTVGFSTSQESETVDSSGVSTMKTEERSFTFQCPVKAYSLATCQVIKTSGVYEVPYDGILSYKYPDGVVVSKEVEGVYLVSGAETTSVDVDTESLLCPGGDLVKDGDREFCLYAFEGPYANWDAAEHKCYVKEMNLAGSYNSVMNYRIHKACNFRRIMLNGFVSASKEVVWYDRTVYNGFNMLEPEIMQITGSATGSTVDGMTPYTFIILDTPFLEDGLLTEWSANCWHARKITLLIFREDGSGNHEIIHSFLFDPKATGVQKMKIDGTYPVKKGDFIGMSTDYGGVIKWSRDETRSVGYIQGSNNAVGTVVSFLPPLARGYALSAEYTTGKPLAGTSDQRITIEANENGSWGMRDKADTYSECVVCMYENQN